MLNVRLLCFFLIFAVSGATGLIYEAMWTRYLKLFLGHAAYAQTLVLILFMGGMAAGAWLASRLAERKFNPLLIYAGIEGLIGLYAIAFHSIFTWLLATSYLSLFPALDTGWLIELAKWSIATLLVLPASVLLGATFPMMVTGLLRWLNLEAGKLVALLYFTNSFGAAMGVLIGGFWMLEAFGLPGTMLTAGLVNVAIALVVFVVLKQAGAQESFAPTQRPTQSLPVSVKYLLIVSALTGFASFIYEIAWIRMLSLVLGSSNHAFEMMLSAFVLGLALGGLWVRNHVSSLKNPILFLGSIQVLMGLFAMSSLLAYEQSFYWMRWAINVLTKTTAGYEAFNVISHGISLLVMLPAAICAGMTLPIITYQLMQTSEGERAVGRVYAVNTIGSILVVILSVQLLMPLFGVKNLLTIGAAIDVAIGIAIFYQLQYQQFKAATSVATVIILAIYMQAELSVATLASGVYRDGVIYSEIESKFRRDGKTASVDVFDLSGSRTIATNGKSDATVAINENAELSPDEYTMALLGILPLMLNPDAKSAASIGIGSGITSHSILGSPTIERVDSIEIEAAMVEGAAFFEERSERVFNDPRSNIVIDDAKTYFVKHNEPYDLIVSEPSNPWISGVASVFSREFYELITRHLAPEGLFVQWLHLYETNDVLVYSVLNALSEQFSDYHVYTSVTGDMIIIATPEGTIPTLQDNEMWQEPQIRSELDRLNIKSLDDLRVRKIATKQEVQLLAPYYPVTNTDYFPFLDLNATEARFKRQNSQVLLQIGRSPLHLSRYFQGETQQTLTLTKVDDSPNALVNDALRAKRVAASFANETTLVSEASLLFQLNAVGLSCDQRIRFADWEQAIYRLARLAIYLAPEEASDMWAALKQMQCDDATSSTALAWINLLETLHTGNYITINNFTSLLLEKTTTSNTKRFVQLAHVIGLAETQGLDSAFQFLLDNGLPGQDTEARLLTQHLLSRLQI